MTLKELFDRSSAQYANCIAISFVNGTPLTYAEMKQEVDKTIFLLCRMGIRKGDRVAILSVNMPNWCIAYFAIAGMGAVVVPILPDFHPDEVQNILQHSGSKAIFVSQKLRASIDHLQSESLTHQIAIEDFSVLSGELPDEPLTTPELAVETDTASIIYTSGTTGHSKGVMLSHRNITFNAEMSLQLHDVNSEDVFLSILPLSHAYENTLGFIMPFIRGASVYYLEKPPTASVLVPAMAKVRPSIMLSVPLIIEKIYRNQVQAKFTASKPVKIMYEYVTPFRKLVHRLAGFKLAKTFGGRLEFMGIGGAKLDPAVERFLREARFPYAVGYGLTETSPLIAGSNTAETCFQGTGTILKGAQVKIDNPDPRTGIGEVLTKGENVMQGYYRDPEQTRSVFTDDGWFRTGDLGYFDKHQRLFLKGRIKNVILGASGENIYPEEIESVINNYRGVIESLVLEQKGKLVAMVCLNMDELNRQLDIFISELKVYINQHVNKHSQIQSVIVVPDTFEKTPTLKIKRYLYS